MYSTLTGGNELIINKILCWQSTFTLLYFKTGIPQLYTNRGIDLAPKYQVGILLRDSISRDRRVSCPNGSHFLPQRFASDLNHNMIKDMKR